MLQTIMEAPELTLESLKQTVKGQGEKLAAYGRTAHLTVLVVGEEPVVRAQAHAKVKLGAELGVAVTVQELPTHISVNSLLKTVRRLNGDPDVDGIFLEPPLPRHLEAAHPLEGLDPEKDVTGYHPANLGRILAGNEGTNIYPLLPKACLNLLAAHKLPNRRVVIFGRHPHFCRPLAPLLANRGAVVTLCDDNPPDLAGLCRQGEIIVTALGQPGFLGPELVREDTVLVDAGYLIGGAGDAAPELMAGHAGRLIPVPRALEEYVQVQLFANLVVATENRRQ